MAVYFVLFYKLVGHTDSRTLGGRSVLDFGRKRPLPYQTLRKESSDLSQNCNRLLYVGGIRTQVASCASGAIY